MGGGGGRVFCIWRTKGRRRWEEADEGEGKEEGKGEDEGEGEGEGEGGSRMGVKVVICS